MRRNIRRSVPPFWWPPITILRQAASAGVIARLTGWPGLPSWMWRHGIRCLPGAGGARGMGCIGFPDHPTWEITTRCNLRCIHCHVSGGAEAPGALSTDEAFAFLDQLAEVPSFRMLAFSGGEPLMRPDFFRILEYSQALGFSHTMATNATLITAATARRLRERGVSIAAVSLDSPVATVHDRIRGIPGAFQRAMEGIAALREAGITLQVNVTVMRHTVHELDSLLATIADLDPAIVLVYQMVPQGRGKEVFDLALGRNEYRELVDCIARWQRRGRMMIEPVAGPAYWASLCSSAGIRRGLRMAAYRNLLHGCAAGRGFVYIKPDGRVWPCPFLPIDCGNVRDEPFSRIYRDSPVMAALRDREHLLKGRCGRCDFLGVCGGCRGRAFAASGDYLGEDPTCFMPG